MEPKSEPGVLPKLEPKPEPGAEAPRELKPEPGTEPQPRPGRACSGSPASVLRLEPKFKEQDVWDLFPPSAPKAEKEAAERDKVIIFSQWTSMLNLLEGPLKISAYVCCVVGGKGSRASHPKHADGWICRVCLG